MSALAPPLLPTRRPLRTGIVAILLLATLLAMVATAGTIALGAALPGANDPDRLIVQVSGGTPAVQRTRQDRAVSLLAGRPDVSEARPLGPRELARLIEVDPRDVEAARLPLPGLIEVTLAADADREAIARTLASIGGAEIVEAAAGDDRSPRRLRQAMIGLVMLAVALAALGAAVAARAERAAARQDLALLRDLGATLRQRGDAIGRPLLRDMAIGVVTGAIVAPLVILWLAATSGAAIGAGGWLTVLLVAPLVMIVAAGAAYLALLAGSGREA